MPKLWMDANKFIYERSESYDEGVKANYMYAY